MAQFRTIGIVTKYNDTTVADTLKELYDRLRNDDYQIFLDHSTRHLLDTAPTVDIHAIGESCDLAIVIGGDGTLLRAARALSDHQIPIVGVNRGRLGFLVDVSPHEQLHQLNQILGGEFIDDERYMLHATVIRGGEPQQQALALNDVVLKVRDTLQMIEFEIWIDGHFVNRQRADGIICSTPTGSTAYALSNGGPIINPRLESMLLQPICPHTLSSRPLVVAEHCEIDLLVGLDNSSPTQTVCDGQIYLDTMNGDIIRIRQHPHPVRLLHPSDYDYYEILRAKLRWG